jgi:Ser/Thr protein kinase RdoA (MazF antagonist)
LRFGSLLAIAPIADTESWCRRKNYMPSTRPSEVRALRLVAPRTHAELLQEIQSQQANLAKLVAQALTAPKPPVKAPSSREAVEAQQDARLLKACEGKTLWLPEAVRASGLTKQIATTAARRLAYAEKIWLSLEPGPAGKLTFRLRSRERAIAE